MDPSFTRPFSIHDLVLDPTLDPSPIAHSMPPKDRLLPGIAVLTTMALLGMLVALAPAAFFRPSEATPRTLTLRSHFVDIALNPEPSKGVDGGGGGGTSRSPGKGLIDPPLPASPGSIPPEDPPIPTPSTFPLPVPDSPIQGLAAGNPNGDGRPKGMGQGNGRGVGGTGVPSPPPAPPAKTFDFQLVPVKQARASYRLKSGEKGDNTIVEVEIVVEDDGRVSNVRPLSGPEFLYPAVCEAARQWTFEPLSIHGLKGPMKTRIRFACRLT